MTTGLLIQYVIIGLILAVCVAAVFRKFAPTLSNRGLATTSIRLSRPDNPRWLRALGHRLQPKQATGDCSDGCSTCGACGTAPPAAAKTAPVPLEFKIRVKSQG